MKKELSLYIHIPFCKTKCNYCGFYSLPDKDRLFIPYFKALFKEFESYKSKLDSYEVKTIYVGGGTPSLPSSHNISELFKHLYYDIDISKDAEITIEGNPESITPEKLEAYLKSGINRLSLGVQAWQDKLLESMGRSYSISEFIQKYNIVEKSGFKNVSLDLIFGLPKQSMKDWKESLTNIVSLRPNHISCYSLEIDEYSKWGREYGKGIFSLPNEDLDRDMYKYCNTFLEKNKYRRYEISNFAQNGYECKHNLSFWKGELFLGLGAGAHSYFDYKRFNNCNSIERYICNINSGISVIEESEEVSQKERVRDFLILGLRLEKGVDLQELRQEFSRSIVKQFDGKINDLIEQGLITRNLKKIRSTEKGFDLINQVALHFLD